MLPAFRRALPVFLGISVSAALPVSANAAYRATAKTICRATSNVNVRSGPGLKYSVKKLIRKGRTVKKIGVSGSWSAVRVQGTTCFVKSSYLKSLYKYMYISGGQVNVRTGPGLSYPVCASLPRNTRLKCYKKTGGWMKISYKNKTCYVSRSYLSSKKSGTEKKRGVTADSNQNNPAITASQSTIRSRAIEAAKARLGDIYSQQYRNQPGYADCSSLMRDIFLFASGINIGETTTAQMNALQKYEKPLSSLKEGDILYHTGIGGNHVAIYIGNNQYIHASSQRKQVITSMYMPGIYWTGCYDVAAYCSGY